MPKNCEFSSTKNWQRMFSFALEYLYEVELFVKCCFYIWKYCWIFCQMWFSFVEIPESFIKMLSVTNIVDLMVFYFTFLVIWPNRPHDLLLSLGVHLCEHVFETLSPLKWLNRFEPFFFFLDFCVLHGYKLWLHIYTKQSFIEIHKKKTIQPRKFQMVQFVWGKKSSKMHTKGVIRIHKSKKSRQTQWPKRTNSHLQNIHIKLKIE